MTFSRSSTLISGVTDTLPTGASYVKDVLANEVLFVVESDWPDARRTAIQRRLRKLEER